MRDFFYFQGKSKERKVKTLLKKSLIKYWSLHLLNWIQFQPQNHKSFKQIFFFFFWYSFLNSKRVDSGHRSKNESEWPQWKSLEQIWPFCIGSLPENGRNKELKSELSFLPMIIFDFLFMEMCIIVNVVKMMGLLY